MVQAGRQGWLSSRGPFPPECSLLLLPACSEHPHIVSLNGPMFWGVAQGSHFFHQPYRSISPLMVVLKIDVTLGSDSRGSRMPACCLGPSLLVGSKL